MEYKVIVVNNFKDVHTGEKYKKNTELTVSEERAFELFSSPNHLVRFVSCDGKNDLTELTTEINNLKEENNSLKTEIDNLTNEKNVNLEEINSLNEEIKKLNEEKEELVKKAESNNADDNEDKNKNKSNK